MAGPENREELNRFARQRFGRDLQGAWQKVCENSAISPSNLDFEGQVRLALGGEISDQLIYNQVSFFLQTSVPAP